MKCRINLFMNVNGMRGVIGCTFEVDIASNNVFL